MTERQRYLFDLQGFVVVEDVLTDAECDMAIEKIKKRAEPMPKSPNGYDTNGTWEYAGRLFNEGQPFIRLIDHPGIVGVFEDIIGPMLRVEGCYSFIRYKGCPPFEMHGGHRGGAVNFRYNVHNNRIFTGLCVVSVCLQDITEEDGGFACIPGSHKSDFEVPEADREALFAVDGPLVRNIAAPRGSAVLFTETLAHGAASWQNDTPRYGLFLKYNDRAAAFHCQSPRPGKDVLDMMTDNQKSFFNTAWQAFGPDGRMKNDLPEFGLEVSEAGILEER